ncbi:MAG: shikimate kinase [Gemmatimonadaceae bacterium]|nr:shikimate kinase [Gemmatimonadaceae bacterium]
MPPRPAHLILIGLPGAGKTTHGRRAAKQLARPFIDLDRRIAHLASRTVPQIFREDGEEGFRLLERKATAALAIEPPSIVAPGGGWMMDASNVDLVKPGATIVWLQVTPRAAVERMGARIRQRPLLASGNPVERLNQLLLRRAERYATADAVINTEVLDWQEVVDAITALCPASADA